MPQTRLHPSLAALAQVAIMFLPGIPAYLWLWPNVEGTAWFMPVQVQCTCTSWLVACS